MNYQNDEIPMQGSASNALLALRARNASNTATIPSAANLPQNIFNTPPAAQPTSVINLSNSSDVVIGPMTQYQGAVTIYQYMDATVEARSMSANGAIRQTNTNQTSTSLVQRVTSAPLTYFILIIIIIISVGVTVFLLLKNGHSEVDGPPREILFDNNYETDLFPNLGNGHLIIGRYEWGAGNRSSGRVLEHPIPYVLILHVGVQAEPCHNLYICSIAMRTFQDSSVSEKNLPDIASNFYIGGDGYVYVGRGWNYTNTYADKSISVAFIGDYIRYKPSQKIFEAVQRLLAYGLTLKYLTPDYKIVAHNQTRTAKSPGPYIYKHISKWPHWSDCGTAGKPKCGEEIGLPYPWNANM